MKLNVFFIILLMIISSLFISCEQAPKKIVKQDAKLIYYVGDVKVNGDTAQLDQIFAEKVTVETGPFSSAEFKFGKETGIQIREKSVVELVKEADVWKPKVLQGAVLNIVQKGYKYRLSTLAGVIAVRGTIFYTNVLNENETYICACNGSIDIISGESTLKRVSAPHHKAHILGKDSQLTETGMEYHTDLEIFDMMYRLDQAK